MKRALSLILALVMCLGLCACGGSNDTAATTDEAKKYNVNDTATSSMFECTLKNVSFAQAVEAEEYAAGYMLPKTESTKISRPAKSGNTLLCFSVNLKYIGKKSLANVGFGNNDAIGFYAVYDSDYQYTTFVASRKEGAYWRSYSTYENNISYCYTFEPLSEEIYSIRAFIEMPEVVQNSGKTLDLVVNLLNNESVTFSINP